MFNDKTFNSYQKIDYVRRRHRTNPSERRGGADSHVTNDGGEQLGRVQVGDGKSHRDQKLANHADRHWQPDHL